MNFVSIKGGNSRTSRLRLSIGAVMLLLLIAPFFYLAGCGDKIKLPSSEQLYEFRSAGPAPLAVDMNRLAQAKIGGGPYKVIVGDVIELSMPAILQVLTGEGSEITETNAPYTCRVLEHGAITLPVVGQIQAAGKTLSQIESDVVATYYPKYAVNRPAVVARVLEYRTQKVSVTGAVQKPGIFELRTDQMTLVALIMEAGGIIDEGAASIKIIRSGKPRSYEQTAVDKTPEESSTSVAQPTDNKTNQITLAFEQLGESGTFGQVDVVNSEGRILLTACLDIAQEDERLGLLRRLAQRQPWASTAQMEQELRTLAESLRSGSGKQTPESRVIILSSGNGAMAPTLMHNNGTQRISSDNPYQNQPSDDPLYKDMEEKLEKLAEVFDHENNPEFPQEAEPLILPIKGLNIPFADVVLHDGDSVIVERLEQPLFTVLGLVNRPGNFPYPPDIKYNLLQAIGFADGLDKSAEPRYATIYRLTQNSEITSAVFQVVKVKDGSKLLDAMNVTVKPGDIVFVEHTPRTRTKVFLESVFRINLGTYVQLENAWN